MSLVNARKAVGLDAALATGTQVIWYKGAAGAEAVAEVPNTALAGATYAERFNAASVANPCVASNKGALESAGATAPVTVTAFAFADAGGAPITNPNRLDVAIPLILGGKLSFDDGDLKEQIAADDDANVDA